MANFVPFWKKKKIEGETLVFVEDSEAISAFLAFDLPRNVVLYTREGKRLTESEDYEIEGNRVLLKNEGIPRLKSEWLQNVNVPKSVPSENDLYGIKGCLLAEPHYLHGLQIFADYVTDGACDLKIVSGHVRLPNLKKSLCEKKKVKLALFGDSISNAANSSFELGIAGFEHWISPSLRYAERLTGANIEFLNVSRSGYGTEWAIEAVEEKLSKAYADVVVIAFGMNDASADMSTETFVNNIETIMKEIKRYRSDAEFILVATPVPNEACKSVYKEQIQYFDGMRRLECDGVALVNMTEAFLWLLRRKRYCEISGNNLNHPNDFGYRFYTDAFTLLFDKILKDEKGI